MKKFLTVIIAFVIGYYGYNFYIESTSPVEKMLTESQQAITDFCECEQSDGHCLIETSTQIRNIGKKFVQADHDGYSMTRSQKKRAMEMMRNLTICLRKKNIKARARQRPW